MTTDEEYQDLFQKKEKILHDNNARLEQIKAQQLELQKQMVSGKLDRSAYAISIRKLHNEAKEIHSRNFHLVQEWLKIDVPYQAEKMRQPKTTKELKRAGLEVDDWRLEPK